MQHLVDDVVGQRAEQRRRVVAGPLAGRAWSWVLARGMRVVALEQDVVGELGDRIERGLLLEPEAPEDLAAEVLACLLYTSPSPRDGLLSRMPSSA